MHLSRGAAIILEHINTGENMLSKKSVVGLFLVAVVLLLAVSYALPTNGLIKPSEATELYQSQNDLAILDVRSPGEFAEDHASNAVNIPLEELANRLNEVPSGPLLILCRSGMRASKAYATLIKSGRNSDNLWFLKGYTDYSSGTPRFH